MSDKKVLTRPTSYGNKEKIDILRMLKGVMKKVQKLDIKQLNNDLRRPQDKRD